MEGCYTIYTLAIGEPLAAATDRKLTNPSQKALSIHQTDMNTVIRRWLQTAQSHVAQRNGQYVTVYG